MLSFLNYVDWVFLFDTEYKLIFFAICFCVGKCNFCIMLKGLIADGHLQENERVQAKQLRQSHLRFVAAERNVYHQQ